MKNNPVHSHKRDDDDSVSVARPKDVYSDKPIPSNPLGDGLAGKAAEKGAGWAGKKLRAGMKNQSTTMTGIAGILGGLSTIIYGIWGGESVSGEVIMAGVGGVIFGIQGILARDADKSSEESNS